MRIITSGKDDLDAEIARLKEELSVLNAPVTQKAAATTVEVFGKPLSPAQVVSTIIADVRARGDAAVIEYERKLDGVSLTPSQLRVSAEEMERAASAAPPDLMAGIEAAKKNIAAYQEYIKPKQAEPLRKKGVALGLRWVPLERVGVYVPAGSAPYPSSVLMNVIPAQVAGVEQIAVATPPRKDGNCAPVILAALHALGITEVYRMGGTQAIAALAVGTESIPPVDKVAGPGNAFVALAKKQLFGEVDIDLLAGPSEIVIIADDTAPPAYVAADLLSQAEHDAASAILVSNSEALAHAVVEQIEEQLKDLSHKDTVRDSLQRLGLAIIVEDLRKAAEIVNHIAPEHLEIMTAAPEDLLPEIKNAGAVFIGPFSPVPVGDYAAGPSHVLPTGGTARFSSGLSVYDFLKHMSVISLTKEGLRSCAQAVADIAAAEGYDAHSRAVRIRLEDDK